MTAVLFTCALVLSTDAPTITAVAGTGEQGYAGDGGPATKAKLDQPFDVAFDRHANMFFSDTNNHCVRRVDGKTGVITTVAGTGKKGFSGDGGPATRAELNEPYGIAIDPKTDNLYVVDRLNYRVRMVARGSIRTVAGDGRAEYAGDGGPADKASLKEPNDICFHDGKLLIADVRDNRIRAVEMATQQISTFAGTGEKKSAGDGGFMADASFAGPRALAASADGRWVYVVEREGNCVRVIDRKNNGVRRFAGTGKKGYTGDGGPALAATFDGPKEIALGRDGSVYVVDTENEAIRRVDATTGVVTTVAGKGKTKTPGTGDGGPATAAALGRPHGVWVADDGAVYIGDTLSHRIRRVK